MSINIEPRKLTDDEINDILKSLPNMIGADKDASVRATLSLKNTLKTMLQKMTPMTPLGIPDLKDEINKRYQRALITPGTPVGVLAAEALGGPVMQMTLNSFHSTGAAKGVQSGLERVRELINATDNLKNPMCTINFKENLTYEDIILKKNGELVGLTIDDVVEDFEVGEPEELIRNEDKWWYELFKQTVRNDHISSKKILRLKLNTSVMYNYNVLMNEVAEALERDDPPSVACIYSPFNIGIMDVYPIEATIAEKIKQSDIISYENASLVFITTILSPSIQNRSIQIKGIKGIERLFPMSLPVIDLIREQIKDSVDPRIWLVFLNKLKMNITGMKKELLINLFDICNIDVIQNNDDEDFIVVKMPTDDKPLDLINKKLKEDRDDEDRFDTEERKRGVKFPRREPTAIYKASRYIFAETKGSNLKSLLLRDDIDPYHTISNNCNDIIRCFGVEAARTFLIREFINVFQIDGSYISPRNIVLLVDFMTNQARITPITYAGIQRQPTGALSKATFEQAMKIFRDSALFGRLEPIKSTSSSIYVGKRVELGTGYMDVIIDEDMIQEYEENLSKVDKVDISSLNDGITQYEDNNFGIDSYNGFNTSSDLDLMFGSTTTSTTTTSSSSLLPSISKNFPSLSNQPPTISSLSTTPSTEVYTKNKPVVSNLLLNVPNVITEVPVGPCKVPPRVSVSNIPNSTTRLPSTISSIPTTTRLPSTISSIPTTTRLPSTISTTTRLPSTSIRIPTTTPIATTPITSTPIITSITTVPITTTQVTNTPITTQTTRRIRPVANISNFVDINK